jgi:hypothetical protein
MRKRGRALDSLFSKSTSIILPSSPSHSSPSFGGRLEAPRCPFDCRGVSGFSPDCRPCGIASLFLCARNDWRCQDTMRMEGCMDTMARAFAFLELRTTFFVVARQETTHCVSFEITPWVQRKPPPGMTVLQVARNFPHSQGLNETKGDWGP